MPVTDGLCDAVSSGPTREHSQALLARALQTVDIAPLDGQLGRRAGVLLARSLMSDAIDAAVAVLAIHGDSIVTSDPSDLSALVEASGQRVDVITV